MGFDKYELLDELYQSRSIEVVRGLRKADNARVVLKRVKPAAVTARLADAIRYEHKILERLAALGVTNVSRPVETFEMPTPTLVVEDFGGDSLTHHQTNERFSIDEVLAIIGDCAGILGQIHHAEAVHRDINPNNIVYNRHDKRVEIIDFGIASFLSREMPANDSIQLIEGTLAFISPEQTGRLNRTLDYRADFYSLGVTMFNLLTERLPFEQAEKVELLYAILTRSPASVISLRPDIALPISMVVDKLMAKNAEERYQSAFGLQQDLLRCRQELAATGQVATFSLGQLDRQERFEIPQKIYGRAQVTQEITSLYAKTVRQKQRQFLLVKGPSGIGKSALVGTLSTNIMHDGGLFAAGKYGQLRRHVPFSALAQAVSALVRRILLEDEDSIALWRARFQDAMGMLGQVLVDIIPAIGGLVGPQRAVPQIPSLEVEARALSMLARFVYGLCKDQPLVLFLDDLQWMDTGTIKLLKLVATDERPIAGLLVVGAYRDNEVESDHPLMGLLSDLGKLAVPVTAVTVAPLSRDDINALITDTTRAPPEACARMGEIVAARTAGNPFFVHAFLLHLLDKGIFSFDGTKSHWVWDDAAVQRANVTQNVVDLMRQKLMELSPSQQGALTRAAYLGNQFNLAMLSSVQGSSLRETSELLQAPMGVGLIIPVDTSYRSAADADALRAATIHYRFAHDKIQQAACELLDAPQAARLRCHIGRRLLARFDRSRPEEWVFEVIEHLNAAIELLTAEEKVEVAQLNLVAGRESKRSLAYDISANYLTTCATLLGDNPWSDHYDVMHAAIEELADVDYLRGHVERAREHLDTLLVRSKTTGEKATVLRQKAVIMTALGKWEEGIDAGLAGLKFLGYQLVRSKKPSLLPVAVRFLRVLRLLKRQPLSELITAAPMTDARYLQIMEMIAAMWFSCFQYDANLTAVMTMAVAEITLTYGNSRMAAVTFTSLSFGFAQQLDYRQAKQFAELSSAILEKIPDSHLPVIVHMGPSHTSHPTMSPTEIAAHFRKTYTLGVETGDLHWAGIAATQDIAANLRFSLARAEEAVRYYSRFFESREDSFLRSLYWHPTQTIKCLLGKTEGPLTFDDAVYREDKDASIFYADAVEKVFQAHKALTLLLHGTPQMAMPHVERILALPAQTANAEYDFAFIHFVTAIVLTAYALATGEKRVRHAPRFRKILHAFDKQAAAGPVYTGLPILLRAQLAAIKGQNGRAAELYEKATTQLAAADNRYLTAVGYECATRFSLRMGHHNVAQMYCLLTLNAYQSWGAVVKLKLLQDEWSPLIKRAAAVLGTDSESALQTHKTTQQTTASTSQDAIDLPGIMRIFQTLASEVSVEKLTYKIIELMRENAGADRACLALKANNEPVIVSVNPDESHTHVSLETCSEEEFPKRLIAYVWRSNETVHLDDVSRATEYAADPYLRRRAPKSVLCAPLSQQGKTLGVIYLENARVVSAFTPARLVTVQGLAAQAAVSLDNAFLYTHLEETVSQRTGELKEANEKLVKFERDATEVRMAGGFAHELRNALSGANYLLEHTFPTAGVDPASDSLEHLKDLWAVVKERAPADVAAACKDHVRVVLQHQKAIGAATTGIRRGLNRGLTITKSILDYAQLGHVVARSERVDVGMVIDRLVRELDDDLRETQIQTDVSLEAPLHAMMSEDHLYIILRNLMANARDAMKADETSAKGRHLSLLGKLVDGQIHLSVSDTGEGIPAHLQTRLFEPFFSTKGVNGTGLGLAMTRKLCELYGGGITFHSDHDHGTIFNVVIPVARASHGGT